MSDYFLAMVTGGLAETNSSSVRLQGVTVAGIEPLIQFIYTNHLPIHHENVCDVLMAGVHLQIEAAVTQSARYIGEHLDIDSCVNVLNLSRVYSLTDLRKVAYEFVLANFPAVVQCGQFLEMDVEDLVMVVSSADLVFGPEYDLLKCIHRWLNHDPDERHEHAGRIARHVRFPLLSLEEINQALKDMPYLDNFLCRPVVERGLKYHSLPDHARVLADSPSNVVRGKPSIVAFLSRSDGLRMTPQCHTYLPDRDGWLHISDVEPITTSPAVACVNNYMVLCGGRVVGEPSNKCYLYDPRHQKWSSLMPMSTARSHFPLVVVNDFLYAIAGFVTYSKDARGRYDKIYNTDSVERFSFETGTWEEVCSWPAKIRDLNACVFGSKIIAATGMDEEWRCPGNVVVMDTETGVLHTKAPLPVHPSTCTESRMVTVRHRLYLIVPTGTGSAVYEYIHAIDQWSTFPTKLDVEGGLPICLPESSDIYVINCTKLSQEHRDTRVVKEHVCGKFSMNRRSSRTTPGTVDEIATYPAKCHNLNCVVLTLPWHLTFGSTNE